MNAEQYKRELVYRRGNGKSIKFQRENRKEHSKERFLSNDSTLILNSIRVYRGGYYVFIDDDWKYCGCFLIESLSLLNTSFVFGTKIINGVFFISADLKNTIDLDYFEEDNAFYIDKRILK